MTGQLPCGFVRVWRVSDWLVLSLDSGFRGNDGEGWIIAIHKCRNDASGLGFVKAGQAPIPCGSATLRAPSVLTSTTENKLTMRLLRRQLLGSLVLGAAPAVARGATAPADQSPPTRTGLKTRFKNSTADWDVLFQRRFVRMIVPYSRTLFFRDKAVVYGTAANGGELLEKWINTHSRPALGQSRLNCPRSRATVLSRLAGRRGRHCRGRHHHHARAREAGGIHHPGAAQRTRSDRYQRRRARHPVPRRYRA